MFNVGWGYLLEDRCGVAVPHGAQCLAYCGKGEHLGERGQPREYGDNDLWRHQDQGRRLLRAAFHLHVNVRLRYERSCFGIK